MSYRILALILALMPAIPTNASVLFTKKESAFNCERILDPHFEMIASGRMTTEMMQDLKGAADEIFGQDGVLSKLGISSPKQTIQFMTGADLNVVSSLNRYPVGHWHDGAMIAKRDRSGTIYEIVIPGRTVRHSLFRDDNPFAAQVSILMHVAGHNHFAVHNRWRQVRTADLVQESYDLDAFMTRIQTQGVHPDEVSRWYQYLLSLTWSQDIINATSVDDVDELKAKPSGNDSRPRIKRTANVLQTYIANLPQETPPWKVEMARRFERLQRYIPGAIRTKIMNEGFATLLQELVAKHTTYNTFNYGIQYCCLLSGVTRASMDNPYWLGLEAWRQFYKRFQAGVFTREWLNRFGFTEQEAQPNIQGLDQLAVDRAFIEWGTKNIIELVDDEGFLTLAFKDGEWLAQQNLAVVRPVTQEEYDHNMGQPPDQENTWQWMIDSREPTAVLKALINQVKGFQFQFPNIEITDLMDPNNGMIHLEISDEIGRAVALDRRSLVQTLLVHARFNERPVSLESTFDYKDVRYLENADPNVPWAGPKIPPDVNPRDVKGKYVTKPDGTREYVYYVESTGKMRVEVRVFPNGKLEAYKVLRDGDSSPDSLPTSRLFPEQKKIEYVRMEPLEEQLNKMLENYLANLNLDDPAHSDDGEDVDFLNQKFKKSVLDRIEDQLTEATSGPSMTLQMAVPTVGKALDTYENYVKRRINQSLERALKGQGGIVTKGNSVAIKALPDIPQFGFDQRSMEAAKDGAGVSKANLQMMSFSEAFQSNGKGRVVPIPGARGQRRWGPNPNQGDGDGDGDQDGDGDEGDQPSDGPKPGEGSNGVSWVDIPLDAYAKALEDVVELPNLRPKGDKSAAKSTEKGGKVFRRDGTLVPKEIIRKAYKRGLTDLIINEEDPDDLLPPEIIQRGLSKLKDSDYVVRGTNPKKEPEINAQVTLILDLSGSMSPYVEQAKRAFYDLRAILMRKYKSITFRFISFDSEATVFDDPDKFFRSAMGGGTSYTMALKKDLEVKQQFPESKYDRFTVVIGDMEEFASPELQQTLEEVIKQSQYVAALKFNDRAEDFGLGQTLKQLHAQEDYFGYAEVVPAKSYTPYVFRKAFKNDENK